MWNKITGIIGPTGSGKSYTAAKIMETYDRAAIYQIKRLHEEPAFLHPATDVFDGNVEDFCRSLGEDKFRYVYVANPPIDEERNRLVLSDFEPFIKCCYHREDMLMIIDEAHFCCDPRYIPVYLRSSVIMGRARKLDIIFVAQRMRTIHHDITATAHEFLFWKITDPGDLQFIADMCGPEVRDRVANLRASVDNRRDGGVFTPGEVFKWTR